jgi:hypothetical protein
MPDFLSTGIDTPKDEQPLSNGEKYILETIRNKKLFYLLGGYIALLGILGRVIYDLWSLSDRQLTLKMFINSPIMLITILFLILTAFFLKYYLDAVHPFTKDIARRKKNMVSFKVEGYKTPYFDEFFIQTPLKKKPLIKVTKEFYDAIQASSMAHIAVAPFSRFVFSIEAGNHKMQFNEKHFIIE